MKLYLSTTSPYSRLALIAALHSGKRDLQLHYVLPWENPADLIARAMAGAQARQNQRTVPSNHDSFRQQQIAAAQQQAAHRRALKNIRYGNEAEQAAAKDYLRQLKAEEEAQSQN